MLNDLDETLKQLLILDLPRVTERIEADGFDVRFDVPNREFRARLTRPTISLFLYNIQENRDLRGRTWGVTRRTGGVETRRPPVRLDCSYMLTAWSNEVEDEHRLLTGAARVLFRNPTLPDEVIQGSLADGIEITTEVAQPENFKDVVDIWSVLDNDLHPSLRVTVTIPLEVDVFYESKPVLDLGRGVMTASPTWRQMDKSPQLITGRLERAGAPVVGALIRADYSSTKTDANGDFSLKKVTPGPQLVFVQYEEEFYQLEANLPFDAVLQLPGGEAAGDGDAPNDNQPPPPDPQPGTRTRGGARLSSRRPPR